MDHMYIETDDFKTLMVNKKLYSLTKYSQKPDLLLSVNWVHTTLVIRKVSSWDAGFQISARRKHQFYLDQPSLIQDLRDSPQTVWTSLLAQRQRIHLQCKSQRRQRLDPWVRKIPWRRAWKPTTVFLPGESHGQRSLAGYGPWGRKESDMTEWLTHTSFAYGI